MVRQARRVSVHPWRDPRLILGVMLVLASTVIGAKAFAAHDDTVAYWAVRAPVAAGDRVDRTDLTQTRVRLPSGAGSHYLRVSDEFPDELSQLEWAHDTDAGVLLERSALVESAERPAAELPLSVQNGSYPVDLRSGDTVDVWVGPGSGQSADQGSERVLRAVRVLSTGGDSKAIGGGLARTILVGAEANDLTSDSVTAISSGRVTLVRVP